MHACGRLAAFAVTREEGGQTRMLVCGRLAAVTEVARKQWGQIRMYAEGLPHRHM